MSPAGPRGDAWVQGSRRPGRDRSARRRSLRRTIGTVGTALVIVAVAGFALIWWGQRSLIYHPSGAEPSIDQAPQDAEEIALTTADDVDLTAWFVPPSPEADRGQAVLYMPGNAGDRSSRSGIGGELSDRGFGVLLLEYRGFGGNPGSPSEAGLASDARAGLEALQDRDYGLDDLIYMGESLGTGVAAGLHREEPPAGLVLRSPFTDLAALGQEHYPILPVGLLLRDEYPVLDQVRASGVPTTIIYGDDDDVVPPAQSREVAEAAGADAVEELEFDDAGHNDPVMFGPEVADAVQRLAEEVEGR